ncbi:hypothetical protein [Shimazuella alba]|uniref:Uncharacterized protein n=1 Tax=Shimazuella alba TaxID=2690964 RepID=A0A6I4VU60_9BACL|nr:hypothetical protein [Shimazuella alba]MXQ54051.1 hypothetical protein [Shimazuella alba]
MMTSVLNPITSGPIIVVNHFEYEKEGSSERFKAGFINPSKGRAASGYAVRLSGWYIFQRDEQYIQLMEGCKLTIDTPVRRIDYYPYGIVEVTDKKGKLLRTMKKKADIKFAFSILRYPAKLERFLTS